MDRQQYARAIKGLAATHPEHIKATALHKKFLEAERKAALYHDRLVNRIVELLDPIRRVNKSQIAQASTQELIDIGKTLKELHTKMGFGRGPKVRY